MIKEFHITIIREMGIQNNSEQHIIDRYLTNTPIASYRITRKPYSITLSVKRRRM